MTAKRKHGEPAGNSAEQRGRPFRKGESGNPRGRPKGFAGLAAAIREETDGGLELARIAISIARGEAFQTPPSRPGGRKGKRQFPKFKDRIEAVKWLSDRGFGKPLQAVEVSGPGGEPLPTTSSAVVILPAVQPVLPVQPTNADAAPALPPPSERKP